MTMSLCGYCTGITLEKMSVRDGYDHQPSWQALRKSSAECSLCDVFYNALTKELCSAFLSDPGHSDHPEEQIRKRRKLDQLTLGEDWDAGLKTNIILRFRFPAKDGTASRSIDVVCGTGHFVYFHTNDDGAITLKTSELSEPGFKFGTAFVSVYTLEGLRPFS